MKVVVYFPIDTGTDYRELDLERVPLIGERLVLDDGRNREV